VTKPDLNDPPNASIREDRLPRNARLLVVIALLACRQSPAQGPQQRSPQPKSTEGVVRVETVAEGLVNPWALAQLPDGRWLVTERPGRLRLLGLDGKLSEPLTGVPSVVAIGQGGLLDVGVDPQFATNRTIFLSFSEQGEGGVGTAVARGRLTETGLDSVRVIYHQFPKVAGAGHFGSRVVFAPDGTLFITQGERQAYRDSAQSLTTGLGKVVRINKDGSIPKDNPFVGRADARPEIWSYGHRNMQGGAINPETGKLWTVEHGAAGGDELNHPEAGKNYGWPVITYGKDYNGSKIGEGVAKVGMEQPVYYWDPVIAPGGMTFYTGDKFPGWKNNILIGGLASNVLVRLVLQNGVVVKEERYLGELKERIRDVQQGADGYLYVVTDNANGRVLRVLPK
jgi:glucose/arabinose dehydrogenase